MSVSRMLMALLGAALAGCAGVATQRAQDLSSAGIAYSQASQQLIDAAMAAAVDKDSFERIVTKAKPDASRAKALSDELAQSDDGLVTSLTLYQNVRASFVALEAYFSALQELADNPQGDATQKAVESLANHVGELDTALSQDKLTLSNDQVTAIGGLAKLVSDQVHGAIVAHALRRDAVTIGRMLALSTKAVVIAEDDVRSYLLVKQDAFYRDR